MMKTKTKKKNKGKIIFIILCIFFSYGLISGIVNLLGNGYNSPLYISEDFIMEKSGEGEYTYSGAIVNESSKTVKVQSIIVGVYESGKLIDAYYTSCFFDGFQIGSMGTKSLYKETYMKEGYQTTNEKLFPNGATSVSVSTVLCKLEDGTEYTLKSHKDVEDEKASNLWMITMGSIGVVTLSIIYIIKRVRAKKQ